MPMYAYRCRDCGNQFDIFQKFTEEALTDCPTCEGTIRRVIQPTGIVFKGTGFYINDSRNASNKSSEASKSARDDAGSPDRESGQDAKSGEKTDRTEKPGKDTPAPEKAAAAPAEPAAGSKRREPSTRVASK